MGEQENHSTKAVLLAGIIITIKQRAARLASCLLPLWDKKQSLHRLQNGNTSAPKSLLLGLKDSKNEKLIIPCIKKISHTY